MPAAAQHANAHPPQPQTEPRVSVDAPRILAMGDSMMAWHAVSGRSVADVLSRELGEPVASRAIGGARIRYGLPLTGAMGMSIPKQFHGGPWDWVVLNGGGNDLWLGCGCKACARKLNKMISSDGALGDIPALISQIRASGARVLYIGYLRSPGIDSAVDACRADGDELERRITALAARDKGVHFLSIADLVPHGDASFHGLDMVHPSVKGSAAIARRAAQLIRRRDPNR